MGFSCGCDEGPEWLRAKTVRAMKQHRCCECGDRINVGDVHEYVVGKWDKTISQFRTCERCSDLRQAYVDLDYCFHYGTLWEDHIDELYGKDVPKDSRAMQLAKSIIRQRSAWTKAA